MIITNKLKMDLAKPGAVPILSAVQDDSYSRNVEIALFRCGMPCRLPEEIGVLIRYRKSDGKGGEYDTLPDGTSAWCAKGNTLTIALAPQVLTAPGSVMLSVSLVENGTQLSTFPIKLDIQPVAFAQTAKSEDYFYVTGFLVAPIQAAVGQLLRISRVNEEGRITATEAVDPAAFTGSGFEEEKIAQYIAAYLQSNPPAIQETDPTVADWAKQSRKPVYTAAEVDADAAGTAEATVSAHNTSAGSHEDIRLLISALTTRLNTLANSTDEDLDQMAEIVAYIKSNKSLIDAVTTSKVSVSDIINNLTTNVSDKPLSAAQGAALKALIDAISVPTKLSQLTNDAGFLTGYTETDPTVPAWAKAASKPSYSADEVGAVPTSQALTVTGVDADGVSHSWIMYGVAQ